MTGMSLPDSMKSITSNKVFLIRRRRQRPQLLANERSNHERMNPLARATQLAIPAFAANKHRCPSWAEQAPEIPKRAVASRVEHDVISLRAPGEISIGVVDDDEVGAERTHHFHLCRAADTSHVCAERLGDLHSEDTHSLEHSCP